MSKEIRQ